ncbi:conserved hypothetical protein [Ricinus communis]|uniref:Uncharacterized protein n=1 Tax=Ricinus communis TaxID=3988 RepID=B9SXG9_RICCO|nr:conserved hypothetical protein [Ricinus communis]
MPLWSSLNWYLNGSGCENGSRSQQRKYWSSRKGDGGEEVSGESDKEFGYQFVSLKVANVETDIKNI